METRSGPIPGAGWPAGVMHKDEADVLRDLLQLREKPGPVSARDVDAYHGRLFRLLDKRNESLLAIEPHHASIRQPLFCQRLRFPS